jgi:two-component system sensor kinase FixL
MSAEHTSADAALAARRHLEDRERLLFTSSTLTVGEMASTLAHELNQPIATVTNVLRGIRTRLERHDPAASDADTLPAVLMQGVQLALDQSLFAARIIARIREYTHARQPRRESLALDQVVRESLALLDWELLRDEVAVELDMPPARCTVLGDEVMLQQLFVNLMRNALEAMRENPCDGEAPARKLSLRLSVQRGGREVVLALRDNGCGLPQDAQQRLFVPFQSTKPNGMGIGLNICRSVVELHQGRLWFSPNSDNDGGAPAKAARGCTFHVALPLDAGAPSLSISNA